MLQPPRFPASVFASVFAAAAHDGCIAEAGDAAPPASPQSEECERDDELEEVVDTRTARRRSNPDRTESKAAEAEQQGDAAGADESAVGAAPPASPESTPVQDDGEAGGGETDAATGPATAPAVPEAPISAPGPTPAPATCLRNSNCTCAECVPPVSTAEEVVGQLGETTSTQPTEQPDG